ncbi:MAG TPA: MFS transporter, partial [Dehalococcoidia bacterium]|nr:MFS transporter [Dehalococcoidia bacterium]
MVQAPAAGELGRLLRVRALGQLAQNALLYALLIAVVERTDSSFYTGLLVAVLTLPSIVLGVLGGTLADLLPIRGVLVAGSWLRAGIVALMVVNRDDLGALYWLSFLFMVVNQVTGPAESAALPRLTAAEGLPRATSLFVLAGMVGQAGGAMLFAPLLLKALGPGSIMVLTVVLLVLTSYLAARLAPLPRAEAGPREALGPRLLGAAALGWRIVASQRPAFLAMALMKGVAVLAPYYVKDTLGITSENTVYIMAPAAIGAGLALLLTPFLARFVRLERLMAAALLLLLASLLGLGLVVQLKGLILSHVDFGISFIEERLGVSSVITLTLLLAVP